LRWFSLPLRGRGLDGGDWRLIGAVAGRVDDEVVGVERYRPDWPDCRIPWGKYPSERRVPVASTSSSDYANVIDAR
jgi:hypothetical protein